MKSSVSWGVVVLTLFLFWPVGIGLLIHKLRSEKTAVSRISNGKAAKVFAWVLFGICALFVLGFFSFIFSKSLTLSDLFTLVMGLILFGGGGVVLLLYGRDSIKTGERFSRYQTIVAREQDHSILHLATCFAADEEEAIADLQQMAKDGLLGCAYINYTTRELVILPPAQAPVVQPKPEPIQRPAAIAPHMVRCKNCGAPNQVVGSPAHVACSYCGVLLGKDT